MTVYFVTGNKHKFEEAKRLIPGLKQRAIDIPEIQHFDQAKIVRAKAEAAYEQVGEPVIVEDTGLYLDCFNGFPGPLIKWALRTMGSEKLADIVELTGKDGAGARTMIAYNDGKQGSIFVGVTRGKIVKPRTESEFDWDIIFQPDGHEKTFAELTIEEKNEVSQRGKAFRELADFLSQRQ